MKTVFKPYEGAKPYVFVSYAHKDAERVFVLLDAMHEAGFRIWYDQGIPWSEEWADVIADHIAGSAVCLVFHSNASKDSRNCREELYYAMGEGKSIFSVYLEDVRFSGGLKMRLSPYQAVKLSDAMNTETFVARLREEPVFTPCRVPGWNKSGMLQWRMNDEGLLTIMKNEDYDKATGTIPDYQRNPVRGGSTAPWMLYREQITDVVIQNDIDAVGSYSFCECSRISRAVIPDSVTRIGECAFSGCESLTSVSLPDSVTRIGPYAFERCVKLASVLIPDSATEIGDFAFTGCVGLSHVVIPYGIVTIGTGTFVNCSNLTHVVLPESVSEIRKGAFLGCDRLTIVEIPAGTQIHANAFEKHTHIIRQNEGLAG